MYSIKVQYCLKIGVVRFFFLRGSSVLYGTFLESADVVRTRVDQFSIILMPLKKCSGRVLKVDFWRSVLVLISHSVMVRILILSFLSS